MTKSLPCILESILCRSLNCTGVELPVLEVLLELAVVGVGAGMVVELVVLAAVAVELCI